MLSSTKSCLTRKNLLLITTISLFISLTGLTDAQWFSQNNPSQNNTLRDVYAFNENTAIVVGHSSIILKTIDGGENWIDKSIDTIDYNSSVYFLNADTGWIVGGNYGLICSGLLRILKTTDAGDTWMSNTIGFGGVSSVHFVDQDTGWVVGACYDGEMTIGIMCKTTDGGINWYYQSPYIFNNDFVLSSVYFVNKDTGFIVGWSAEGSIFKTTDGGENWTSQLNNSYYYSLNSVYFIDDSIGWATGSEYNGATSQGVIFKTTNGGENWENQSVGVSNWLSDIYFVDENTGWAVGEDGIILNTTDGGDSWIIQPSGTTNLLFSVHFIDENTGWAVGENGTILKTTNGGIIPVELTSFTAIAQSNYVELKWTTATELNNKGFEIERSEDNVSFNKIGFVHGFGTTADPKSYSYSDQSVYSGTFYYRLKQVDYDGSYEYSDVVEVNLNVPIEYSLQQNYPNPFNPSTTIEFALPTPGFVTLSIFNILSEKVATLVSEELTAGSYKYEWDATELTSGVYFYHLRAGDFIEAKKMLLLK